MPSLRLFLPALILAITAPAAVRQSDVVIYGCTSGGVTAAIQTKKMGKSVVMVCPEKHLGGLTAGGLGWTDSGNKAVIGGLSREFYHRVWQHYDKPDAWRWQKRDGVRQQGPGNRSHGQRRSRTMWIFEPHVAEQRVRGVGEGTQDSDRPQRVARPREGREEAGRPHRFHHDARREDLRGEDVHRCHLRRRPDGGGGRRLSRRPRSRWRTYDEKWNGVQTGVLHHRHHFGVLQDADLAVRRSGRSEERRASAHQHGAVPASTARATRKCRPTASACA